MNQSLSLGNEASDSAGNGINTSYGFVYVVAKEEAGPLKIGKSVNPQRRIGELERASGTKFAFTWISQPCNNYGDVEVALHVALRRYRGLGEWFNHPFPLAVDLAQEQEYVFDEDARLAWLQAAAEKVKPPTPEIERAAKEYEKRVFGWD